MHYIKKYLGFLWIIFALVNLYLLVQLGLHEIMKHDNIHTIVQWTIFIIIFIPIVVGLIIFGYYALGGAYTTPESEEEE